MLKLLSELIYPPKCVICDSMLDKGHIDLCPNCRKTVEEFTKPKNNFSFIAGWTSLWYYKQESVRNSLLRFKFGNRRSHALSYGRLLAMRLIKDGMDDFDLLTWIPISFYRRLGRAYDQAELLAKAIGQELGVKPVKLLKKCRNTRKQSLIRDPAHRRANVLGAFQVRDPALVRGKRILLLDDIVTSGATASECAKMLMIAGAKEVRLATVASAVKQKA